MLRAAPMPLRQGALLGPGAHTTAPNAISPHLLHIRMPLPVGMHSPLPMLHLGMDTGQPNTPVSEVMSVSAWLRGTTANLIAEVRRGAGSPQFFSFIWGLGFSYACAFGR